MGLDSDARRVDIVAEQLRAIGPDLEFLRLFFEHVENFGLDDALSFAETYAAANMGIHLAAQQAVDLPYVDLRERSIVAGSSKDFDSLPKVDISDEDVDDLFALYALGKKPGLGFNHKLFANALWDAKVGVPKEDYPDLYAEFEIRIAFDYSRLPLFEVLYDGIDEQIDIFVSNILNRAARVVLWSQGDCTGTGFQPRKIHKSKIYQKFRCSLDRNIGVEGANDFVKNKTGVIVFDNKLDAARDYFEAKKAAGYSWIRIVVVEDSYKNIERLRELAVDVFEGRADVQGVYVTYSRKGGCEELTSSADRKVDSFNELGKVVADLSSNAEVFVDFDGVLSDNVLSRKLYTWSFLQAVADVRAALEVCAQL